MGIWVQMAPLENLPSTAFSYRLRVWVQMAFLENVAPKDYCQRSSVWVQMAGFQKMAPTAAHQPWGDKSKITLAVPKPVASSEILCMDKS